MAIQVQSTRHLTFREVALPRTRLWQDAALVVGFSLFVALCAQVSVPWWPVPFTGQTLAVVLAGAVLGPRLGALAMGAYLAEALAGLPVLAGGQSAWTPGRAGVPWLLGPTVGYVLGFAPAAYLVGRLAERGWDRGVARAALAMALGNLVVYACGVAGLLRFAGPEAALATGVLPFLPGDAAKIALAAVVLPSAWSLLGKRTG